MEPLLTLTQLDRTAAAWIEREAQRTGLPVETVIRQLIYRGLEVERQKEQPQRHHDLDALAGTWSIEEAAELHQAIADMEQIDSTLWQ